MWWLTTFSVGVDHAIVCLIQAIGDQYLYVASWCWPLFFAIYLYMANIWEKEITDFRPFHIVAWGFPAVLCIVGYFLDIYGLSGLWCRTTSPYYHFAFHEGLLGVIMIVQLYILVRIVYQLYHHRQYVQIQNGGPSTIVATSARLLLFVAVPVLCWSWAFSYEVDYLSHGDRKPPMWLQIVHNSASDSEGLMNTLVYGFNQELIGNWQTLWRTYFHYLLAVRFQRNRPSNPQNAIIKFDFREYDERLD